MVRELAGGDVARYEDVLGWPLGDALAAYEDRLRDDAQRDYYVRFLSWSVLAAMGATKSKKPPELPGILKD